MDKIVNKADPRRKGRYIFLTWQRTPVRQALIEQLARKPPEDNNEKGKRSVITISNEKQFSLQT